MEKVLNTSMSTAIDDFGKAVIIMNGKKMMIMEFKDKKERLKKDTKVSSKHIINANMLKKSILKQLEERANNASNITLDKINLVMYDNGKGLIEPAYYVETLLSYKDAKKSYTTPHDFYIPALDNPQIIYPLMSKSPVQPMNAKKEFINNPMNDNE